MIEDKIKEVLDRKEYLEEKIYNEYTTALTMLIGIFLAGGISLAALKNWLVVVATIIGTSLPFDIYYYRTEGPRAEIKELEAYLKDLYFIQQKRSKNSCEKYTEDIGNNNIEKVNDLVNENYEYNYFTPNNTLRRIRKRYNEKKINFEIKN